MCCAILAAAAKVTRCKVNEAPGRMMGNPGISSDHPATANEVSSPLQSNSSNGYTMKFLKWALFPLNGHFFYLTDV